HQFYVQVGGTARQREAGELVVFHRLQDAVADCMAAAGSQYAKPKFIPTWVGWTPGTDTGATNWLVPLGGTALSDEAQRLAPAQRAELASETGHLPASMTKAEQDAYWLAIQGCQNPSNGY